MKTETLHKLIESNLEWLYQQMGKYHVEDPMDCVHDIVAQILSREELYAKAPENLPVEEFRKWFSAYIYWQFRADQRASVSRMSGVVPFHELNEDIPLMWDAKGQIELKHDLDKAFAQFEQPFRSQLRAVLEGEITMEQLAKKLKVPFKTAETRVRRARLKLQDFLQKGVKENSTKSPYISAGGINDVSA